MPISPKQFVSTSEFHKNNLQAMLEQHIDLPEAPGLLVAMLYLQKSINAANDAAAELEKIEKNDKDTI